MNVLTINEINSLQEKYNPSKSIELTLIKTKKFDLKPFGKFIIKWKTPKKDNPNVIPFHELNIYHETSMPLSEEQDKEVIKFMKKHKTDILTDGDNYYTRAGSGFTEVVHKKLIKYSTDESFRTLVDTGKSF